MPRHYSAGAIFFHRRGFGRLRAAAWLAISRLGFVSHRCQLKAIRASAVPSDNVILCALSVNHKGWPGTQALLI